MKSGPRIALAVGVGYALGRSRKMKLAIALAGMMAGRKMAPNPKELLDQGTQLVGSSPEVTKLTGELRERLVDAAKTAAVAAATSKIDSLGENLNKRAEALRNPPVDQAAEERQPAETAEGEEPPAEDERVHVPEQASESPDTEGGPRRDASSDRMASRSAGEAGDEGGSTTRSRPRPPARPRTPSGAKRSDMRRGGDDG
jgi:hypothetical protein